ncbi:MAG: hypothetical protein MJE77_18655 [Proteobacteria bacterium]|nr:hypothetical protein [Pseudomonadota bacterium]
MGRKILYRSEYRNSTVSLCTADGRMIGLVAGKHGLHFPYFHDLSEWDNLLIYADGIGYAHSERDISALQIELRDGSKARIVLNGEFVGSDRRQQRIDIDLHFEVAPGNIYRPGKIVDWAFIPGMRWQPFYLELLAEQSTFAVAGQKLAIACGCGELELGELVNLVWRSFAFRYDYTCLAQPDRGRVLVDFATRSLTRRTLLERAVDWLLRRTGRLIVDFWPESAEHSSEAKSDPTVAVTIDILVEDRVDLGFASLDRQLVAVRDQVGHELIGLREIFHPQPHVEEVA